MSIAEKLVTIAENEHKVYQAGHAAGAKSEYDRFWDVLQNKGDSTSYAYMFYQWTDEMYNPKYPILFSRPDRRFSNSALATFQYASITDVLVDMDASDLVSGYGLSMTFNNAARLVNARTIKVSEGTLYNAPFAWCSSLEEVRFDGVIGQNGLSFQHCSNLSVESVENIIAHLSDTATGKTVTFRSGIDAKVNAERHPFKWAELVGSKTNWTIALV